MKPGAVVIKCLGLAGGADYPEGDPTGQYLAGFLPEAGHGWGAAEFCTEPSAALVFPDFKAAYEFIGTRPKSRPTRPDGKPNRPLTAFTLQIMSRVDLEPGADAARVLAAWVRFQASPSFPRYVARRVRAGARAVLAEERRLAAWFASRLGDKRPG